MTKQKEVSIWSCPNCDTGQFVWELEKIYRCRICDSKFRFDKEDGLMGLS